MEDINLLWESFLQWVYFFPIHEPVYYYLQWVNFLLWWGLFLSLKIDKAGSEREVPPPSSEKHRMPATVG